MSEKPKETERCFECGGKPRYDKAFGDDKECLCGHPYYRHFDTYDEMAPVGCKYCGCQTFMLKMAL